jgi:hypothetical protein
MVNHIVYHYFQAADLGLLFVMLPELTEEEELRVSILISTEGERKAFPGIEDALALSMARPLHLGCFLFCGTRFNIN